MPPLPQNAPRRAALALPALVGGGLAASVFALSVLAPPARAQQANEGEGTPAKTLRGTVTDAQTGRALPSANIFVDGTRRGTITNQEGRYRLRLDALPATVVVRFVGYETERLRVSEGTRPEQDVALAPATAQLEGVTVEAERLNGADVMRRVIERKQERRDRLRTYRADAYNRFVVRNDTGVVSVVESLTDFYWSQEKGAREVVRSQRQTQNLGVTSALPAGLFVTNLYDDEVNVAGYRLIGVTAPDALDHYRFRIDTVRALDDRAVYDIRVEPRNRLGSVFTGRVSVLAEAFALLEAELEPARSFLFPPPIRELAISYRQQFSNFGKGFWLPVSLRSKARAEVALPGLLSFPAFRIEQVSRLSDYEVNAALPDSLYDEGEETVQAADLGEEDAAPGDSLIAAQEAAVVPLPPEEVRAVSEIDSTQTLEQAFAPSGLLAELLGFSASVNDEEVADTSEEKGDASADTTDESSDGGLGLSDVDITPRLRYNRVEGGHLGARLEVPLGAVPVTLYGEGGYQTARRAATYGAGVEAQLPGGMALEAGYHYGVDPRYGRKVYGLLGGREGRYVNSLRTLVYGGEDYFDYYGNERVRASLERALPGLPFESSLKLGVRAERHFSVEQNTGYDLLGRSGPVTPNPSTGIDEAGPDDGGSEHLRSGVARLALGSGGLGALLGVTGTRRLVARAEVSPGGVAGNDFDFAQFAALADYRVETFLQRRLLPMTLDLRLTGATFTGTVPLQRFAIVETRAGLFGALRAASEPYEGEQRLAAFWEHNFRTAPFEALGLYGIAQRGWSVLLFGGHARAWVAEKRRERLAAAGYRPNTPDGGFHHEIGIGLSGLGGVARVDVAKRLDRGGLGDGWAVSLGLARVF
jgi:hypothetical protein